MIRVGAYILNEKLIKYAVPYTIIPETGVAKPYPTLATKITFVDNSEMVFESMDCNFLFNELEKIQEKTKY